MRASYFRVARCKYVPTILFKSLAQARVGGTLRAKMDRKICVPTILSESLAQARVAGTLRAKTERNIWITYSGVPSPPRAVTGKNVLIHFAEKNNQISLYNVF